MTSPVQQQLAGKSWQISFVMPSKYNMDSLPVPNNNRVRLKEILTKKFVVIEFSGTNSNENVTEHENQLMSYIEANQIKIIGSPKYAFYNAPWTLPFLRRNEVMIEINHHF
jgi:SOUL heme-binding protein.